MTRTTQEISLTTMILTLSGEEELRRVEFVLKVYPRACNISPHCDVGSRGEVSSLYWSLFLGAGGLLILGQRSGCWAKRVRCVSQDVVVFGVHNNVANRPNAGQDSTYCEQRNNAAIEPQLQAVGLRCL